MFSNITQIRKAMLKHNLTNEQPWSVYIIMWKKDELSHHYTKTKPFKERYIHIKDEFCNLALENKPIRESTYDWKILWTKYSKVISVDTY